jgi:3-oxoacyl-[acyl-carrier protein] reductase
MMMGALDKRVAVISGAGTGLGRAAAISFAKAGADVVLLGRRIEKLEETAQFVKSQSGKESCIVQTDVSDEAQVQAAIKATLEQFSRIDILLNNAAVLEPGTVLDQSTDEWQAQISVNLTGPFLLTKAVLPIMRKHKYGRVINITSGLSQNGSGGFAAYSAAKAGLESLTRTVADEEYEHGIGKDPTVVTPDLIRLASLPPGGATGTIVSYG